MKKRCTILSLLAVVLLVVCLCGCPSPSAPAASTPSTPSGGNSGDSSGGGNSSGSSGGGTTPPATVDVLFTLKSMPYDAVGLKAGVEFQDNKYNILGALDLGTVTSIEQTFTGAVDEKAKKFRIWLYGESIDDKKYMHDDISCVAGKTAYDVGGWWQIASNTGNDAPKYGISPVHLEEMDVRELTTLSFTDKKFYVLKFENVKDQKLKIEYKTENAEILISSDLDKIYSQTGLTKVDSNVDSGSDTFIYTIDSWETDVLYMLVRPEKYEGTSSVKLSVVNLTELLKNCLLNNTIEYSEMLSETEIIFKARQVTTSGIMVSDDAGKSLHVYNMQTGEVTLLKQFDDEIMYLIPFGDGFLFATGKDIRYLDKTDRSCQIKKTMEQTVMGMCLAGDELFVLEKYARGAYPYLLDTTTFETTKTSKGKTTKPVSWAQNGLVFMPDQGDYGKIYYIPKGVTSLRIECVWLDGTQNVFGNISSYDSGSFTAPLKQLGTTQYIVAGSNDVFNTKGNPVKNKTGTDYTALTKNSTYLFHYPEKAGSTFIDIEFTEDYYYMLTNTDKGYVVLRFDLKNYSPSGTHEPDKEYLVRGQKGAGIILSEDGILVTSVAVDSLYHEITSYPSNDYYPVSVTRFDFNLEPAD